MANSNYIGSSKVSEEPKEVLRLTIVDGAITTSKIADEAVTEEKLSPEVVEKLNTQTAEIVDGAITTPKIANGAVTEEKLSQDVKEKLNRTISADDIEEESITADKLNEDVWDEVKSIAKREVTNEINAAGASKAEMTKLKSDVGYLNAYIGGLDQGFICRVGSDYTINDIYLFPNETIYIHITEATGFSGGLEIWVNDYYSERKTFDHSQLNSGDWVSVPVSELIGSYPELQASITIHSITLGDATDYEGVIFVK